MALEDPARALLRRRRLTELAGVATALGGLAVSLTTYYSRSSLPAELGDVAVRCILIFGPLTIVMAVVSWAAFRTAATRWYMLLSGGRLLLDTAAVAAVVYVLPGTLAAHVTGLAVLPVLTAGVRLGLAGAFATWATMLLAYLPFVVGTHQHSGSGGNQSGVIGFLLAATLGFFAALITGLQTRAMNRHLAVLETARNALHHQASHDALTGLANRSALYQQAADLSGEGALLVIDLDRFKAVNDSHGHAAGDAVLRTVATRLRICVTEEDLVVRVGGDEFVVLLPGADAARADAVANTVRAELGRPIQFAGQILAVGGSVGVALTHGDGPWPIDALAAEADARMYREKASNHTAPQQSSRKNSRASA